MDITALILDDHHRLRQGFARLDDVDRSDTRSLELVWGELAQALDVHAAAEEAVFYPALLKVADEDGEETEDAIGDHNDIRDAIAATTSHEVGSDGWWEAVGAARAANTEHLGEEEDEVLPDFRRTATLQQRHDIGVAFLAAKAEPVRDELDLADKDPDAFIEDARD